MARAVIDRRGLRYERLLVIDLVRVDKKPLGSLWECLCDCGTTKNIYGNKLRVTKSCGCLMREYRNRQKTGYALKHGHAATRVKRASDIYIIWMNMLRRCSDPKDTSYTDYGGRGIAVCERWRTDFRHFMEDLGPRPSPNHTVDRKDNNGNYDPSNCFWATRKQQARNRRNTVWITHNEETKSLAEWAEIFGLRAKTLQHRLKAGWSLEDTLTRPVKVLTSRKAPHANI